MAGQNSGSQSPAGTRRRRRGQLGRVNLERGLDSGGDEVRGLRICHLADPSRPQADCQNEDQVRGPHRGSPHCEKHAQRERHRGDHREDRAGDRRGDAVGVGDAERKPLVRGQASERARVPRGGDHPVAAAGELGRRRAADALRRSCDQYRCHDGLLGPELRRPDFQIMNAKPGAAGGPRSDVRQPPVQRDRAQYRSPRDRLAARLKALVAAGILERRRGPSAAVRS